MGNIVIFVQYIAYVRGVYLVLQHKNNIRPSTYRTIKSQADFLAQVLFSFSSTSFTICIKAISPLAEHLYFVALSLFTGKVSYFNRLISYAPIIVEKA